MRAPVRAGSLERPACVDRLAVDLGVRIDEEVASLESTKRNERLVLDGCGCTDWAEITALTAKMEWNTIARSFESGS